MRLTCLRERQWLLSLVIGGAALAVASGCDDGDPPVDGGSDAGPAAVVDAGPGGDDAGPPDGDAGPAPDDGGPPVDGGGGGLGEACAAASECGSGYCVDGVCCDVACDGECAACDLAGSVGTCAPRAAGTDDEAECGAGVCDGAGACAVGATRWASGYAATAGGTNHAFIHDVAVDASGLFVVGTFRGVVDFGGGNLVASGGNADIFVARYGLDGAHVFSRRFGTNIAGQDSEARAVAITPGGDAVVVGVYGGAAGTGPSFGGGSLPHVGGRDLFVVQLDPTGAHVRSAGFGGTGNDEANDVAVASDGRVLIAGGLNASATFGATTVTSAGRLDALLVSLDASFGVEWALGSGGAMDERAHAVAVDVSGAALVTGELATSVAFGGAPQTSAGFQDIFLARIDAVGALDWLSVFGDGAAGQIGRDVAVGSDGVVYVAGSFRGTIDLGGGPLTALGASLPAFWIGAFDNDGSHRWSATYGDDDLQDRIAIDVSDAGLAVVTGFEGQVDFGAGPLVSAGQRDASVARLAHDGTALWSRRFGDASDQDARAVAIDASGATVVVGKLFGTIDFDVATLSDSGAGFGVFVARFDP